MERNSDWAWSDLPDSEPCLKALHFFIFVLGMHNHSLQLHNKQLFKVGLLTFSLFIVKNPGGGCRIHFAERNLRFRQADIYKVVQKAVELMLSFLLLVQCFHFLVPKPGTLGKHEGSLSLSLHSGLCPDKQDDQ